MATRKASDSNLTGKKYNDASAGATKIPDVPNTPSTPTTASADAPSVAFTPASRGGVATNYVVSNGTGNLTWTGSSSPISATGMTPGTAVSFRVKAVNSSGESSFSSNSATVSVTGWGLAATLNSTQNWTVPTGVTKIGVAVISGGATGGQGSFSQGSGTGGRSGSGVSFWDFATNAGTTYLATVGGTGGDSSFGSLATAGVNASSNVVTNRQLVNSAGGGSGNTLNLGSYQYNAVTPGGNSASLVLNAPVNGPFTVLHGGGGGGNRYEGASGSTAGGNSFGGAGGDVPFGEANRQQVAGQAGRGPGGGGGAGGSTAGGAGSAGRILVFTFTA